MNNVVILAEKPSQARDYADAYKIKEKGKSHIEIAKCDTFPDGAIITWAIGHLLELDYPQDYDEKYATWRLDNLPINPKEFNYSVPKDKKTHYAKVVKLLKQADVIVNGTDADRAGEAIFYNIILKENIKNKTFKRLWINSKEVKAVREGMKNLLDGKEKYNLALEERARQKSDWLVGMNMSPLFSLLLQNKGYRGSLGVGRVQSPTVYLIYQRQKEIQNFKPESFYQIEGHFTVNNVTYKGMADVKEFSKDTVEKILNEHEINGSENGIIQSVDEKKGHEKSPKLHSLDTLQRTANKQWKYTPKDVLKTVQELYDKKILTYPRTDCNFITENEFSYIKENLDAYKQLINIDFEPVSLEPKKRYVDSSKVEEHYAIVPTEEIPNVNNLTEKQKNIYFEVIAVTLGMFHNDYTFEETTIITSVNDLEFKSIGKVEKNKGWKELFPNKKEKKEKILPLVQKGDDVNSEVKIKEGITKPPKPYTEGQLIDMMMTCGKHVDDEEDVAILKDTEGIGTNATRSDIIEKIKKENYIEVKNNIVNVTQKGIILCESIKGTLLASPSMTAKWESYLAKIGKGEGSEKVFIDKINQFINKMIEEIPQQLNAPSIETNINKQKEDDSIAKCPSCSEYIIDKGKFYGCSGYKNGCKVTFPKKWASKNLSESIIKTLCEKGKTNKLKGFKGKKGDFQAVLKLDENYKLKFDSSK